MKEETKLWIAVIFGFIAIFGLWLLGNTWRLWYHPEISDIIERAMAWGMGIGAITIFLAHECGRLVGLIIYKRHNSKGHEKVKGGIKNE